jgi:hypothetical protein
MSNVETYNAIAEKIESILKARFPNGHVRAKYSNMLSTDHITVSFGLIGDIEDVSSKIRHNDPLHHSFMITVRGDDKYEARNSIAGLMVKPSEGSYLAMDSVKTPFRKTTGDEKRIIKAFERFADRTVKIVKDNVENIYNVEKIPTKYLEL